MLMCRNIKTLFNFEPPVTDEEIRAAALQFVRKVSGFNKPSKANEAAFLAAADEATAHSSGAPDSGKSHGPSEPAPVLVFRDWRSLEHLPRSARRRRNET